MAESPDNSSTKPKRVTAEDKCNEFGIDAVCERVAECITLQVIAEEIGVSKWSLIQWINSDANHNAHARARERQADKHAADILAIADEVEVAAKYDGEDVKLQLDSAAVARNRLRVDTRKWLAAKMAPKRYGERQQVDVNDVTPRSIDDVRARLAELTAKATAQKIGNDA